MLCVTRLSGFTGGNVRPFMASDCCIVDITWEGNELLLGVMRKFARSTPSYEGLVLEWMSSDTGELAVFRPEGWGREHLSMRWREDLEAMAGSSFPDRLWQAICRPYTSKSRRSTA